MKTIPIEKRLEIFKKIADTDVFETFALQGILTDFISEIWPISSMQSEDPRYNNMSEDIHQHCVNNRDYSWEYVFDAKLSIQQDETKFRLFLEKIVLSKYYRNSEELQSLIKIFNNILTPYALKYKLLKFDERGLPVYILSSASTTIDEGNILPNKIPFFVDPTMGGQYDKASKHEIPKKFPAFVLSYNTWNDFSVFSLYNLFYYDSKGQSCHIGRVKILNEIQKTKEEMTDNGYRMSEYIPKDFTILSLSFCSLGQDTDYYKNIKECFPSETDYLSVLWALKDCAVFPFLQETYEHHNQWHSLIRDDEAERMLREAIFVLNGQDVKEHYKFTYQFRPKYADEETDIHFEFNDKGLLPRRIYGLIGKNGVGKTQLLSSLPIKLASKDGAVFDGGATPIYSKIIAISNSYYDSFEIPDAKADFNYVYCGLSGQKRGGDKSVLTLDDMKGRIITACEKVERAGHVDNLKEILQIVFSNELLQDIIKEETDKNERVKSVFNRPKIVQLLETLSSGESSLLYLFFNIIAHIRYDSLLLFDEPETHLHPNAITELMTAIYKILDQYQSYAIIATHSPMVIREMKSDSVYVFTREGGQLYVAKPDIETLGASSSTIIEEIFDNKGIQKHFKKAIREMKDEGMSYDKIVAAIQSDDVPLGLALTFYIRNLFDDEEM